MERYYIAYDVDEVISDLYHVSVGYATAEEAQKMLDTYPDDYRDNFSVYRLVIEKV